MRRVLELEDIFAGYGETEILHGVSLHVDEGEIVVIIGPNGAGKSTAMKAVFGLLNITRGAIRLTGEEITNTPPQRVVRKGVAYVPQVGNVFVSLSVEENLEMGAYVSNEDPAPRIEEIFQIFPPLREKRRQPAGALSGGQRQMVAMGRALMLKPKILLLDEPTAGLSPKYRGEIFQMIRRINDAGATILMVEQNARMALEIADRGYVLVDGENRYSGSGRELIGDAEVARMFLGGGAATGGTRGEATGDSARGDSARGPA